MHAACAAVVHRLPPSRYSAPRTRTVCLPFDSWQEARAFNQPLSFDTSSVTDMHWMFYVRSSPWPAPNLQSSPPLHAALRAPRSPSASRPLGPHLAPAPHALRSTLGSKRGRSTSR
eukprot:scaffold62890_cov81-Phaeocystis_antarctica.AAC.1